MDECAWALRPRSPWVYPWGVVTLTIKLVISHNNVATDNPRKRPIFEQCDVLAAVVLTANIKGGNMARLVVSEFVTLDGVFQDPGGAENFDKGGWSFKLSFGAEGGQFKQNELMESDALLLGRVTYTGFAKAWPNRSQSEEEGEYAKKINAMPKYVFSTMLTTATARWNNTHIIKGIVAEEVNKLKAMYENDILVFGSGTLVQALMRNNLVDEYRLMIWPTVLGTGKKIFQNGAEANLQLTSAQAFQSGVALLIFSATHT